MYKRILVVINPGEQKQPALDRAVFLAKKCNSELLLVSCIYDDSYDMTQMLSTDERFEMKEALLRHQLNALNLYAQDHSNIAKLTCHAAWHKKMHQGIIQIAKETDCDLIVKSTKTHDKFAHKLFTPNDWHILRNSPVSVLMVKNHDWPVGGNIVAAVSVGATDEAHECLSKNIVDESAKLALAVDGQLHIANTFMGAPVHISIEVPQFSPELYNKDVKEKNYERVKKLADEAQLQDTNIHVSEGLPEDVLPAICKVLDSELLVLGSVGRKGLSAALLGNTAEHIIDQVNCDTLVVKP